VGLEKRGSGGKTDRLTSAPFEVSLMTEGKKGGGVTSALDDGQSWTGQKVWFGYDF
jgi:hypothetical protein